MSNVAIGIDFEAGMCGEPVAERFYLRNEAGEFLSPSNFCSRWEWNVWTDGATSYSKAKVSKLIDTFLKQGVHLKPVNVLDY